MGESCKDCGCTSWDEWWMTECHTVLSCVEAKKEAEELAVLKLQMDALKKETEALMKSADACHLAASENAARASKAEADLRESNRLVGAYEECLTDLVKQHFEGHGHECPDALWVKAKAVLTVALKRICRAPMPFGQSGVPGFCCKPVPCPDHEPPMPPLDGPEPMLSPEDQAALDAIKCKRCGLHGLRCVFCTPASSSTCGH